MKTSPPFTESDYHKPEVQDLAQAVQSTMSEQLGRTIEGPVSIITHLRTFGYCFNPVSFYYCWNEEKTKPHALMAEITNTPWHERYAKCFRCGQERIRKSKHSFDKGIPCLPFHGNEY